VPTQGDDPQVPGSPDLSPPSALLLRHAEVYAPQPMGVQDLLVLGGRIAAIHERLERPRLPSCVPLTVVDLKGQRLVPGLVDQHVHLAGGGGEGGFVNRTPPVPLSQLARNGVTTAVGLLGTDGITRSVQELYARVMAIQAQGLSAYLYTGAYEIPTRTITGSVRGDLVLLERVLGTGEIAISDDRSSHPSEEDLAHLAAETRVGALLAGKAGVMHLHVGPGRRGILPLLELIAHRDLPPRMFVPTHMNRSPELLEQGRELVRLGGNVDLTTGMDPIARESRSISAHKALAQLLAAGTSPQRITLSSDAGGSIPVFGPGGHLVSLDVGRTDSLWHALRSAVLEEKVPLPLALATLTENPARILGLVHKGRIAVGADADLISLTPDLRVDRVWAQGRLVTQQGEPLLHGRFEGQP
jgi:beta-aspartyl-dipeptidase (metallo-type)